MPFVNIDGIFFNPEAVKDKTIEKWLELEMKRHFLKLNETAREAKLREVYQKLNEALNTPVTIQDGKTSKKK